MREGHDSRRLRVCSEEHGRDVFTASEDLSIHCKLEDLAYAEIRALRRDGLEKLQFWCWGLAELGGSTSPL